MLGMKPLNGGPSASTPMKLSANGPSPAGTPAWRPPPTPGGMPPRNRRTTDAEVIKERRGHRGSISSQLRTFTSTSLYFILRVTAAVWTVSQTPTFRGVQIMEAKSPRDADLRIRL
jgi:hypothetical protein